MVTNPADLPHEANPEPAPSGAPLAGTRSQSMQRLQIGLLGLGAMVLLVSLANIISNNAQQNEALVVPEAAPTVPVEVMQPPVRDPLAEAGLVPGAPDKPQPSPTIVVPDLSADAAPAFQP